MYTYIHTLIDFGGWGKASGGVCSGGYIVPISVYRVLWGVVWCDFRKNCIGYGDEVGGTVLVPNSSFVYNDSSFC